MKNQVIFKGKRYLKNLISAFPSPMRKLMACLFLFPVFLAITLPAQAQVTYSNCSVTQPSSYSQQQFITASGTGLNYAIATAQCGNPVTLNLPSGATPVTGFMWVQGSGCSSTTSTLAGSTATYAGHSLGTPQTVFTPVSLAPADVIYDGARWGLQGSWFTAGGSNTPSATFALQNCGTCKTWTVAVLYQDTD